MKASGKGVSNLSHKALNMTHLTSKIFVGICLFTAPKLFFLLAFFQFVNLNPPCMQKHNSQMNKK